MGTTTKTKVCGDWPRLVRRETLLATRGYSRRPNLRSLYANQIASQRVVLHGKGREHYSTDAHTGNAVKPTEGEISRKRYTTRPNTMLCGVTFPPSQNHLLWCCRARGAELLHSNRGDQTTNLRSLL